MVEANTFSLAHTQGWPDKTEPSDGELRSGCHEDAERSKVIGQRTVLDNRRGLVDSCWHKLQLHDGLEVC